jgi:CRISPR/Cas system-associated protein Cas10 (large subunit of type III CRISPR-Cas system)
MLEWCSAAEGARWQHIMKQAEEKRLAVQLEMIQETRSILKEAKVPGPRNPRAKDENQPADYQCLVCGESWSGTYKSDSERSCSTCRSNSVRWIRKR